MIGYCATAFLLLSAFAGHAAAAVAGTPEDFTGKWRISRWVGESQGGFSGPDPNSLIGKIVQISGDTVATPDRTCHMQNATVATMRNSDIEASLWGGQRIDEFRLPRQDIAHAFGHDRTRIFHDSSLCISAVMIDHDHIIDAFGSGVIYRLDRVK